MKWAKFRICIKQKALIRGLFFLCGAGGVRTLVQTTSFQAFYMLIPRLFFDPGTDKNTQNLNLGTEFRICLVPSQTLA